MGPASQLPLRAAPKVGTGEPLRSTDDSSALFSEIPQVGLGCESCFGFGKSCRIKAHGLGPTRTWRWGVGGPALEAGQAASLSACLGPAEPRTGLSHRSTFPEIWTHPVKHLKPQTQPLTPTFLQFSKFSEEPQETCRGVLTFPEQTAPEASTQKPRSDGATKPSVSAEDWG